jgi:hypothetical protein
MILLRRRATAADQIRGLVGDHQGRRVEIGRDHPRHDRGIDHAQALQPVHAELVVDHGPCGVGRAHPAGAAGMKRRGAALRRGCQKFVVGLHAGPGVILIGVIGRKRLRGEQPPR